jgi:hypothetical protein
VGGGGGWEEGVGGRRGEDMAGGGSMAGGTHPFAMCVCFSGPLLPLHPVASSPWRQSPSSSHPLANHRPSVCFSQALCSLCGWQRPHPHGGRVQAAHTPLQITAPLFVFHRPSAPSAAGSGLIPMAAESKKAMHKLEQLHPYDDQWSIKVGRSNT